MKTKYQIYIISKGRPKCITAKSLDRLGVEYTIVVEPQEVADYRKYYPTADLIITPFQNLGQGSIPVRNFVWEYSIKAGQEKHWILDDNIEEFYRLNRNTIPPVRTGAIFTAAEDFTDRFTNVDLSGFNYNSFCKSTDSLPPFYLNTRIYSCTLINNSNHLRWRGRFNEDTDLSLRVLKNNRCTILFNAFLCGKVTTMRMKGGNTNELYEDTNNRLEFAQSLEKQHPDVVKVVWKFNRWHHNVNYKPFRDTKLILKPDLNIKDGINNYGMVLGKEEK